MKNKYSLLITLLVFIISFQLNAKVQLPSILHSNMVMQQQVNAKLWGKASNNTQVKIETSWDNKKYKTMSDNQGNWLVTIQTPVAGGPYIISISDGEELKLANVLVGEVWVCSGQSNMQMPLKGYRNQPVLGANEVIAASKNKSIRLFTVKRNKSLEKQDDFEGEWLECTPGNVIDFSAAAYFFGQMVQQVLDVPVGLICSSWGGTRIEPWISEEGIQEFKWINTASPENISNLSRQHPSVIFNGMISPMTNFSIKGAIWYQGESNRNQPDKYVKLMPALVENWRKIWGIGDFPFYFCQIAPFKYSTGKNTVNSAYMREAQLNASKSISNVEMACLIDIGDEICIHPADKENVGKRLAFLALAKTYNIHGIECSGPVLKEMKVEGNKAKLTFEHARNGLTTFGQELVNFKIAGEDKKFYPANAFITNEGITLSSNSVEKPVAVRYAFEDFVVGELFNTEGLPASSFRTDNWEIE